MQFFTNQPIIVPWDFSEMSNDALQKALELAESPKQIEVVHVTPYPSVMEPNVVWGTFTEEGVRENLIEYFHKDLPADKYEGLKFTVLFGDPGSEITNRAKEVDAGLIVISSHGRTGIKRFLLGSVAERVTRLAPCPVLVLRDDSED